MVACYRAEVQRERLPALVLPAPRRDLAALAMFQKGNLLVTMKKTQDASEAYQEGLRINPADTPQTPALLQKIALDTRYNLELLLRSGQAHGQGQGNGNGKGQGQGNKPGDGQQPSDQPGTEQQRRGHLTGGLSCISHLQTRQSSCGCRWHGC